MDQVMTDFEMQSSDTTASSDPEWRYVPVRRTSMDDGAGNGGGDVAMEDLVLQTEGDIAGNFRDTADGGTVDADTDTLVFADLSTESPSASRYDDDGDLDLYVVNTPGGDNALDDGSSPRLQEEYLTDEVAHADAADTMTADTLDGSGTFDLV